MDGDNGQLKQTVLQTVDKRQFSSKRENTPQ